MPNWCENSIKVHGDKENLFYFHDLVYGICGDEGDSEQGFSFDKIVPMPKNSLRVMDGIVGEGCTGVLSGNLTTIPTKTSTPMLSIVFGLRGIPLLSFSRLLQRFSRIKEFMSP